MGTVPAETATTTREFQRFVETEIVRWGKIVHRRPRQAWSCRQCRPPGREPDGCQFFHQRVGGKAAGTAARTGAGGHACRRAPQPVPWTEYRVDAARRGNGCQCHGAADPGPQRRHQPRDQCRPSQVLCASERTPSSTSTSRGAEQASSTGQLDAANVADGSKPTVPMLAIRQQATGKRTRCLQALARPRQPAYQCGLWPPWRSTWAGTRILALRMLSGSARSTPVTGPPRMVTRSM